VKRLATWWSTKSPDPRGITYDRRTGKLIISDSEVDEGPFWRGKNLFIVRNHTLYTPSITASILPGITRDTVITLAKELGFTVREEMLPREMLYIADEAFFVGTAVEITPIRTVDKIQVGNGKRGPITEALQQAFFDVINGRVDDKHGWLEYVYAGEPRQAAVAASSRTARG
jgi:branched-chain amino acid aminotransferase